VLGHSRDKGWNSSGHAETVSARDNREVDLVGADAEESPDAAAVISTAVAPGAELVDRGGVKREAIDALATAGFLGTPLERAAQRELAELISAADASTWFCWVQHQSPLRSLAQAVPTDRAPFVEDLKSRWLGGMESGRFLAAVAFAHLRRAGAPNPVATRVAGGWVLNGTLDWVTSWDIADVVMVMARGTADDAGNVITCFLPAGRSAVLQKGLEVGEPLRLLAMSGTHTRPITLRDFVVPDESVAAVEDLHGWLAADSVRSADANPAAFGVTRGALSELHELATERGDAVILEAVEQLAEQCRDIRRAAYDLADRADEANSPERLDLRAASLDLVVRATTAVVIARAGAGVRSGMSAERRVREAMFLQVQAQTADSRRAGLKRLAGR
jgi:alkylation response protein AidB-like acyl-CoA dehydrogenase